MIFRTSPEMDCEASNGVLTCGAYLLNVARDLCTLALVSLGNTICSIVMAYFTHRMLIEFTSHYSGNDRKNARDIEAVKLADTRRFSRE
jgi:hypothetical protein